MTATLTRIGLALALVLGVASVALSSNASAAGLRATKQVKLTNRASAVMLNPQPLPPGPCKVCGLSTFNRRPAVVR